MGRLKVGGIGRGSMASRGHLREYKANDGVDTREVCDIIKARAQEIAKIYEAKAYTNDEELIANDEIDIISVCLPNNLHAPATIAALNAGKHVLCEKPMATSLEEAEQMIAAANKNNKKIMIGQNQRVSALTEKARNLIASGKLGKIYSFRTTFGHSGPEDWSVDGRVSWFFNE